MRRPVGPVAYWHLCSVVDTFVRGVFIKEEHARHENGGHISRKDLASMVTKKLSETAHLNVKMTREEIDRP